VKPFPYNTSEEQALINIAPNAEAIPITDCVKAARYDDVVHIT
jgi:hypothetical protein